MAGGGGGCCEARAAVAGGGGASGGGPARTRSTSWATRLKGAAAAGAALLRSPAAEAPAASRSLAAARPQAGACRPGNEAAGARGGPAPHPPCCGGVRGGGSDAGCRCGSGIRKYLLFRPRAGPPRRRRPPMPRRRYPRHRELKGSWGGVADRPSLPPPLAHSRTSRHTSWPVERRHKAATHAPPRRRVRQWRRCVDGGVAGRRGRHHSPQIRALP